MTDLTRRAFLHQCTLATLGACAALTGLDSVHALAAGRYPSTLHEADFYTKLPNGDVQCTLCPCSPICSPTLLTDKQLKNSCNGGRLIDGQTCVCNVRMNRGGTMYVTNYGRSGVLRQDPIEKNPLYHFHPAVKALTVSAPGCSLACKGCQNWQLAIARTEDVSTVDAPPAKVITLARQEQCKAISYTYTEPMMFYEYMTDIARLAKDNGMWNTIVSGGYVNPEPVKKLCQVVDAFSISVKAFNDQDYIAYARGRLTTIQKAMETVRASGRWLEVVVLVIPTVSDNLKEMRGFLRWVKANLGADTPIHLDRFWPSYKLANLPQTPTQVLEDAREMAVAEGLRYAYVGNLPGHRWANTYCSKCGKTLIRRVAFHVEENRVKDGACPACRQHIAGEWQ